MWKLIFHCHQYENTNVKFSLSVYACMYDHMCIDTHACAVRVEAQD